MKADILQKTGVELKELLKLKSSPLAIKLLEKELSIPDGAKRPVKDFGRHLSLCQAYSIARRQGLTIAMTKEDMWCFYPVIGYGLEAPVDFFMEGNTRYPETVDSAEAAKKWAKDYPRLNKKYEAVVFAPLENMSFEPDVVMIYADSAQILYIVKALTWKTGVDLPIQPRLCPVASCVYSMVLPLISSSYAVTFPDGGERMRAIASDDEIVFSLRAGKLPALIEGVRHANPQKSLYKTSPFTAIPEYNLNEANKKVGKLLGMSRKD